MSAYGHGPTARENQIIALNEAGDSPATIATKLGLQRSTVEKVIWNLCSSARHQDDWKRSARAGSEALLAAIGRHFPERILPAPPSNRKEFC